MEKKEDLRVRKTKANIRQAFLELCQKKAVSKITVTELAGLAMINKGTFYLHYDDIYALYLEIAKDLWSNLLNRVSDFSLFLNDPAEFVREWYEAIRGDDFTKVFPHYTLVELGFQIPLFWVTETKGRIYAANAIEKTPENEIRLDCIICDLLIGHYHHQAKGPEITIATMADMIRHCFQDTSCGTSAISF